MRKVLASLRSQMITVFIICSLIITIIISAFCIRIIYQTMEQQATSALMKVTGEIDTEMQIMLEEATRLLSWGDVDVVADFFYGEGARYDEAIKIVAAFKALRDGQMIGKSVRNIFLLDTDGIGYNEKTGLFDISTSNRGTLILDGLRNDPSALQYYENNNTTMSVVIGTAIRQTATRIVLGYMAVELNTDTIDTILSSTTLGSSGSFFIMDRMGTPLFGDEADDIPFSTAFFNTSNQSLSSFVQSAGEYLVACRIVQETGWYVVGYVPAFKLMSEFYSVLTWITAVVILVLVLTIALYLYITKRITYPIQRLKSHMLMAADGNLDAIVEATSKNEFAILEEQYNRMLSDIKALMKRNCEEQEKLKRAELRALQAQINPHFLYNTLETIIWMVAANDNNRAIEMIEQLVIFFRIGLSKGLDWISVREDIEHLQSYLYIQSVRYSDLLVFEVNVDESIMDCFMLKMTLQPIVENAIYHGIKNKKDGGRISVSGHMDEDGCLLFRVSDTGVGMSSETQKRISETLEHYQSLTESSYSGFGLLNVDRRIKLYCGDEFGLSILSEEGIGTEVTIRLMPKDMEADDV